MQFPARDIPKTLDVDYETLSKPMYFSAIGGGKGGLPSRYE